MPGSFEILTDLRKAGRDDKGQATVEFVVVFLTLCFILFAIVEFGGLFNNWITLTDATRAGSRVAAVSRSYCTPAPGTAVAKTVAAVQASAANLNPGNLNVTVSPVCPWTPGGQVTVTATYPYSINLVGLVVTSGNLTSTTTERIE
jgi:Flp pilus assembly protein TadG